MGRPVSFEWRPRLGHPAQGSQACQKKQKNNLSVKSASYAGQPHEAYSTISPAFCPARLTPSSLRASATDLRCHRGSASVLATSSSMAGHHATVRICSRRFADDQIDQATLLLSHRSRFGGTAFSESRDGFSWPRSAAHGVLFDHLCGANNHRRRHGETERLSNL